MTNRLTKQTARKPIHRALDDWRTMPAARSGVRPSIALTGGGAVNRSAVTWSGGRVAGRRCSGGWVGWSVIYGTKRPASLASRWRPRRGDPRLAEGGRPRPEGDLAGGGRPHAATLNGD